MLHYFKLKSCCKNNHLNGRGTSCAGLVIIVVMFGYVADKEVFG
jgi:hypothetical protein